jgi:hypothetical protein
LLRSTCPLSSTSVFGFHRSTSWGIPTPVCLRKMARSSKRNTFVASSRRVTSSHRFGSRSVTATGNRCVACRTMGSYHSQATFSGAESILHSCRNQST